VQVFNSAGALLYFFGHAGSSFAEFQLPSGLAIDSNDHIYVADSYNHRVQKFEFVSAPHPATGRK
jgi:DNA-binding beta-propeller fold protein YncE